MLEVAEVFQTRRASQRPGPHPRLSPGLKVGAAVVIGTVGSLALGWSTHTLFVLLLAGLTVPMAYGALVWYSNPPAAGESGGGELISEYSPAFRSTTPE
ncbi:MAG: hypothetical protein ACRDN9_07640 [Streptosporangiaceae bacterium]